MFQKLLTSSKSLPQKKLEAFFSKQQNLELGLMVDLSECEIDDNNLNEILEKLSTHKTVSLNLSNNKLTNACTQALTNFLKSSSTLSVIDISGNNALSYFFVDLLKDEELTKNKSLQVIFIKIPKLSIEPFKDEKILNTLAHRVRVNFEYDEESGCWVNKVNKNFKITTDSNMTSNSFRNSNGSSSSSSSSYSSCNNTPTK